MTCATDPVTHDFVYAYTYMCAYVIHIHTFMDIHAPICAQYAEFAALPGGGTVDLAVLLTEEPLSCLRVLEYAHM